MLGFYPLASVPLSSLPNAGDQMASGFTSGNFGTPLAVWDQLQNASGFTSSSFGTPTHARGQPASGFTSSSFGTPFGQNVQVVSGFTSGTFGAPRIFPFSVAPGIHTGAFGTPAGHQYWQAQPIIEPGRFGTPFVTFNQSQQASGFTSGTFGRPMAIRYSLPDADVICFASAVLPGRFGTPAVKRWAAASGFTSGHLGTPTARIRQTASGLTGGAFGTPSATLRTRAAGFRTGTFGASRCAVVLRATGLYRAPRWGLVKTVQEGVYVASSLYTGTRMGQPTGRIFKHTASGFTSGAFGAPAASHRHRVSSIAPCGRFGTPLLRRNTQC